MKGRSGYSQKVVPISPYFHRPAEDEQEQEKELPADLATVQRWLNYADVALSLPERDLRKDKKAPAKDAKKQNQNKDQAA